METLDPFATQGGDDGDPFADSEVASEIPPEVPVSTEAIAPVVDREGQPVGVEPEDAEHVEVPVEGTPVPDVADDAPARVEPEEGAEPKPVVAPPAPQEGAEEPKPRGRPRKDGADRSTRLYKVLCQTGERQWTEIDLGPILADKDSGVEVTTQDGETWIVAHNNNQALRIGFGLLGSPQEGATILAAPKGLYNPKRIKPKVVPERQALEIT